MARLQAIYRRESVIVDLYVIEPMGALFAVVVVTEDEADTVGESALRFKLEREVAALPAGHKLLGQRAILRIGFEQIPHRDRFLRSQRPGEFVRWKYLIERIRHGFIDRSFILIG